jgi:adenylate cyclase
MTEVIFLHEGTLDKFLGDGIMAVFGAPLESKDHAVCAVRAALDMREELRQLNAEVAEDQRVDFRMGLHSGRVVAGDIGSARRSDYTVLGANVNLAARIQSNVAEPGQIIISDATREQIGDGFETRLVGEFQPRGISKMVRCYELLGVKT